MESIFICDLQIPSIEAEHIDLNYNSDDSLSSFRLSGRIYDHGNMFCCLIRNYNLY